MISTNPEDLDKEQEIPQAWEPKDNEKIIGILVGKSENVGKYGSTAYRLRKAEDNEIVTVWGSAVLDKKMVEQDAQMGDTIGIKFLGKKTGKDNKTTYKDYTVLVEKPGKPKSSEETDESEQN